MNSGGRKEVLLKLGFKNSEENEWRILLVIETIRVSHILYYKSDWNSLCNFHQPRRGDSTKENLIVVVAAAARACTHCHSNTRHFILVIYFEDNHIHVMLGWVGTGIHWPWFMSSILF
ncbi:hypothetical protein MKX03_023199 [Papaver bracteatum]|nr:hypothetical protein MKX03_023199 [Papaver bracteatum]